MSNSPAPAAIPRSLLSPALLAAALVAALLPSHGCCAAGAAAGPRTQGAEPGGGAAAAAAEHGRAMGGLGGAAEPTGGAERAAAPAEYRRRPELPADRPLRAAFLIVDGVYNTELVAPFDVFHHTPFHTDPAPGIEVFTVSPDGGPVTTFEGLVLHPDHGFADAPPADLLVVPSAEGSMDADLGNAALIEWVKKAGAEARWVVSLCDGAFVLAEAGLLDGHAATTFPADYDRFAERFPEVDLRINVSFVHDGRMLTSQGGVRSFDVAMYLVDLLYGPEVARRVGAGLLIPWPLDRDVYPPYTVVIDPGRDDAPAAARAER
jgi:putative intracellular protease/amidase